MPGSQLQYHSLGICCTLSGNLQEVAEFTAKAERYVGVISGGMDQAISVMGMPGTALMVEFNPVRREHKKGK